MAREYREYETDTTPATPAGAGAAQVPSEDWETGRRGREYRRVLSAGTLKGDGVRNPAGDDLGKIEEIMLDVASGRVAYAVLSFGGFLGIGNKLFAIPWESLTLNEDDHVFILDADKDRLENAPGFDKDNWPDMADRDFGSQIYNYYGVKPYWDEPAATSPISPRGRTRTSRPL
ncbi:MAG TPA: PRC-barrel domain-containing protein [Bryobacteraceae bacterium]|jgi:sporulation protein YlmC with PRC-barrel domain